MEEEASHFCNAQPVLGLGPFIHVQSLNPSQKRALASVILQGEAEFPPGAAGNSGRRQAY